MFDNRIFRSSIVEPALRSFNGWNIGAEELLVATMAHESLGGKFFEQQNGPALGIYQMEPATYSDIWTNYLSYNSVLKTALLSACGYTNPPGPKNMVWDLRLATLMARAFYTRHASPLPPLEDINAIWEFYKQYWNTTLGSATKTAFVKNYQNFVGK